MGFLCSEVFWIMVCHVKYSKGMPGLVVEAAFVAPCHSSSKNLQALQLLVLLLLMFYKQVLGLGCDIFIVYTHRHYFDFVWRSTTNVIVEPVCYLLFAIIMLPCYQLSWFSWITILAIFSENPMCCITGQKNGFNRNYPCRMIV